MTYLQLVTIHTNIGSRYNGIPLYIYLTYTLCIMAVILQTRCFQMDNWEPDLSFSKYVELDCFRWLYIYGHICDFLSRYAQLKEYILLQSEQPGHRRNIPSAQLPALTALTVCHYSLPLQFAEFPTPSRVLLSRGLSGGLQSNQPIVLDSLWSHLWQTATN